MEGTFSWVNPNTIATIGTNEYEVVFTPNDTINYNTVTTTASVTVNALPKDDNGNIKVDDDNYDDLKDILDDYDKLPEEDKKKLDDKTKKEIEKLRDAIDQYEEEKGITTDPIILENPTASNIYLGQNLSNSTLLGGKANVDGSFSWVTPNIIPSVGTNNFEVVFTPTKLTRYNTVTITVSVTVNELPKDDDGNVKVDDDNYDDLKDIVDTYDKLPEEDKEKLDDKTKEEIEKIREGIEDYQRKHGIKTDPIIFKNPVASKISYGQYLSSSNLSGGKANVEGEFTFSKPKLMPKKGIQAYEVVFTPTKSDVYNPIVLEVEVEVEELVTIPSNENKPIEVNKDNYEELKEIVDNYNNLTEEEKNELDPEVKEEIQRIEKAIQEYKGGNNLAKVLILSIGVPCSVVLLLGIIVYLIIRKRKR